MKKNLIALLFSVLLMSCGGSATKQDNQTSETTELTTEQETNLSDSLSAEIKNDAEEVQQATDKKLQEVDSLLENF